MEFLPVDLNCKSIINNFLELERIEVSDIVFSNLYIWHFSRDISYLVLDDCLVIQTKFPNEAYPFLFYPVGNGDKLSVISKLRDYFLDNGIPFSMRSLDSRQVDELEYSFPGLFNITPNRNRFDYLYRVDDLIKLNGRKLHGKRNHLNRFLNLYPNFIYERMDANNAMEVLATYRDWFNSNDNITDGLVNEFRGIESVLTNFDMLDTKGCLIRIDNRIAAFSLGEQINDNTVVIHIEKGNTFYSGIYQAINQQFLLNDWSNMEFVNREEDLGIEGLRHAKMTYNPIKFVEKFNAIFKEGLQ